MKNGRLKALLGVSALTLTLSCTNTVNAASKYATTTANLNFRTGPSTSNKIITTIKKGSKVEVISKNGNWTKIKYNNREGYSSSQYLKEESTSTGSTTTQKTGVVTADVLNIRSGASTNYSVVTKANKGEKVTILESKNGWYKVKLSNGKTGWGSAKYITIQNVPSTSTPSTGGNTTGEVTICNATITGEDVNLRETGSWGGIKIMVIKQGSTVEVLEKGSEWTKIRYSGKTGYVPTQYVSSVTNNGSTATPPQVKPEKPQFTTSKVTTNYNLSFDEYAQLQNQKLSRYSVDQYKNYMDINQRTSPLQFLRIDKFRDINVDSLNSKLQGEGVLEGQGQAIYNASKKNNIDPVYFISQSILETGHGKSTLAKGVTITEIADTNKPITDVDGNITGYEMIQLDKPTTVYNLYGIGAYDNLPTMPNRALVLGTTRAYNEGWTSLEKAIDGAASFVSNNYIHSSKYNQNTVYKFRFNPVKENVWHQYATDIGYADKIGSLMNQFKGVYTGGEFTFDIPSYSPSSTSVYSLRNIDSNKIDETHLSIGDITKY